MYSYVKDNEKVGTTAEGIKNLCCKKDIKHEDYKHAFFNNKQICHKMKLSEATITNLEAMS